LPMFFTHGTGGADIGDGAPEKYLQGELVTVGESGWSGQARPWRVGRSARKVMAKKICTAARPAFEM
jgi:hypothetical protein